MRIGKNNALNKKIVQYSKSMLNMTIRIKTKKVWAVWEMTA